MHQRQHGNGPESVLNCRPRDLADGTFEMPQRTARVQDRRGQIYLNGYLFQINLSLLSFVQERLQCMSFLRCLFWLGVIPLGSFEKNAFGAISCLNRSQQLCSADCDPFPTPILTDVAHYPRRLNADQKSRKLAVADFERFRSRGQICEETLRDDRFHPLSASVSAR